MCSGSEAGYYLRLIDFVYHSTLGLKYRWASRRHSLPRDIAPEPPVSSVRGLQGYLAHKKPPLEGYLADKKHRYAYRWASRRQALHPPAMSLPSPTFTPLRTWFRGGLVFKAHRLVYLRLMDLCI